jgi:hypothetical protein
VHRRPSECFEISFLHVGDHAHAHPRELVCQFTAAVPRGGFGTQVPPRALVMESEGRTKAGDEMFANFDEEWAGFRDWLRGWNATYCSSVGGWTCVHRRRCLGRFDFDCVDFLDHVQGLFRVEIG